MTVRELREALAKLPPEADDHNVWYDQEYMTLLFACSGYAPIDTAQPYQSRPPKLKTSG